MRCVITRDDDDDDDDDDDKELRVEMVRFSDLL